MAEMGTNELRLTWSARGLTYLLRKHGIEEPLPITSPSAQVELRIIGGEVREVRWLETHGSVRDENEVPGRDRAERGCA